MCAIMFVCTSFTFLFFWNGLFDLCMQYATIQRAQNLYLFQVNRLSAIADEKNEILPTKLE